MPSMHRAPHAASRTESAQSQSDHIAEAMIEAARLAATGRASRVVVDDLSGALSEVKTIAQARAIAGTIRAQPALVRHALPWLVSPVQSWHALWWHGDITDAIWHDHDEPSWPIITFLADGPRPCQARGGANRRRIAMAVCAASVTRLWRPHERDAWRRWMGGNAQMRGIAIGCITGNYRDWWRATPDMIDAAAAQRELLLP